MPEVIFNGPEGRLEGRYHHSEQKNAPVALVLHPNPSHGGTMNNKVVYFMYNAFKDMGFSVLRFNFRGVERSQGKFDGGVGELSDAATALDWLQQQNPDASTYWISGFSFGAWIGMQLLMRRPEVEGFIAVSPPVNMYDFSFLSPCPSAGLILQGTEDSVVPEEAVSRLANKLSSRNREAVVEYQVIPGADHFFREKLPELSEYLKDYIRERVKEIGRPKKVKLDRRRRQA